jgi:hypothetical protein
VKRVALPLLLFFLAAAYMWLGLLIPVNWTDEGMIVYPIWRVAEGEIPYRDFQHLYGPSLFYLNGLLFRIFGADLAVVRYGLLAVKAATCVMVYLSARRVAAWPFAAIVFGIAVVLGGLVWPVSTVPYASFYGTALCFAGLLGFLACKRRFWLACVLAGVCFGLAATFKQTTGTFAFLALTLYLLSDGVNGADGAETGDAKGPTQPSTPNSFFAILIRLSRWFVLLFTTILAIVYLIRDDDPFWNFALLLTPLLVLTGHLAWRETHDPRDPARERRAFWGMVSLSLAFLAPAAGYALFYGALGLGPELLYNTVTGIPALVAWSTPFPIPTATFVCWLLASLGSFACATLWRRRDSLLTSLPRRAIFGGIVAVTLFAATALAVGGWQARTSQWWFWGSSDLLFAGLPICLWLSFYLWIRRGRRTANAGDRTSFLFLCYATMAFLWLFPSADIWHVIAIVPSFLPLLAYLLDRFWRQVGSDREERHWESAALIASLALVLVLPAIHDLMKERTNPPGFEQPLPRATGLTGGSGEITRRGGQVVRYLSQPARRDEPVFMLSGKSLFYFLADRVSPVQDLEFLLYLIAYDMIDPEVARAQIDQDALIRRFDEVRPLLVDDAYDEGGRNVRRVLPRFTSFLRQHYRPEKAFGGFRVLRWNSDPAEVGVGVEAGVDAPSPSP